MHQRREAGGWVGPSTAGDAGGGGVSPESPLSTLMRLCVKNSAATKKWHVGDLLLELLPPVGRSGVGDPSGVVANRS